MRFKIFTVTMGRHCKGHYNVHLQSENNSLFASSRVNPPPRPVFCTSHYSVTLHYITVFCTSHNRSLAWVVGVSRTMAPIGQFSQNKQRIANIGQQTVGNKPNLKYGDCCNPFVLSLKKITV